MQRKKISAATNNTAAIIDLDDDEQLVEEVTTIKRTGKQRTAKPEPEPAPSANFPAFDVDGDGLDDADEGYIDAEPDDGPAYSETSLAALLYGEAEVPFEEKYCTISVRRNPDNAGDQFATPCRSQLKLPPMRNVDLASDRDEIEDRIRQEFGGGHYFFQIHFEGRLRNAWSATLSDPIAASRASDRDVAPAPAANPQPAVDPMDKMLDDLRRMNELKTLLGANGDADLKAEIAELKAEIREASRHPAEPKSERLLMFEQALATTSPDLQSRLINHLFPPENEEGGRHWLADLFDVAIQNKDTLLGIVGSLLGPMPAAAPAPPPQPTLDDILRMQPPPPTAETLPPGGFRRRTAEAIDAMRADVAGAVPAEEPPPIEGDAETPAENSETEPPAEVSDETEIDTTTDDAAIDAEDLTEAPPRNPVRSKTKAAKK